MSNGKELERLFKLQAKINMLVLDGKRDPEVVSDALQKILSDAPEMFRIIQSIGIIKVPSYYNGSTYFEVFAKKYMSQLGYFDFDIIDENFTDTADLLKVGDRFCVDLWVQTDPSKISNAERVNFLKSKDAVFLGAHGLGLVFEQVRADLPDDCYLSYAGTHMSKKDTKMLCLEKDKGANQNMTYGSYELRVCSDTPKATLLCFRRL